MSIEVNNLKQEIKELEAKYNDIYTALLKKQEFDIACELSRMFWSYSQIMYKKGLEDCKEIYNLNR